MSKYITYQLKVDAEPMTLGTAITTGIHKGFFSTKDQDIPGFRITICNSYVLWISKKDFEKYFFRAETDADIIKADTAYKTVMAEQMHTQLQDRSTWKDESVSTNASLENEYFLTMRGLAQSLRFVKTVTEKRREVAMKELEFFEADYLMHVGYAVGNASWIQSQYFLLRQKAAYHPSYFARNKKFPVNRVIMEVMSELMDTCTADNVETIYIVDINTGHHVIWDGKLSDTDGSWQVVY